MKAGGGWFRGWWGLRLGMCWLTMCCLATGSCPWLAWGGGEGSVVMGLARSSTPWGTT